MNINPVNIIGSDKLDKNKKTKKATTDFPKKQVYLKEKSISEAWGKGTPVLDV